MEFLIFGFQNILDSFSNRSSRKTFEVHECESMENALKIEVFRKFYVVVNYYLVSLSFQFHEDPNSNARARVVNARTRDKTCARVYSS